jgi:glucose-1-phosphate thymidylyltransferase
MTVVIPLAGYGTRLRPLTYSIPKPLLLCGGDTVLGWIFKSINSLPFSEIVLMVGYRGDAIKSWVGEYYADLPVKWVSQDEPLGLGHAIWRAGEAISSEDDALIYLGDSIFDLDWSIIEEGKSNFVGVQQVDNPRRFGVAKVDGDRVVDLIEKPERPSSNLAVVGLYYIKKWDFLYSQLNFMMKKGIKTKNEYQLTDALKLMLEKEHIEIKTLPVRLWYDCGKTDALLQTNAGLLKNPPCWIDFKDRIKNFSYVCDSSELKNTDLGSFVTVGENSFIEKSSISNSIIGNNVKIFNSHIYDSIIGDETEIVNGEGKFIVGFNSVVLEKES